MPQRVIDNFFAKHRDYFAAKLYPTYIYYLGKAYKIASIEEGYRLVDEHFLSDRYLEDNLALFYKTQAKEYLPGRVEMLASKFGDRYAKVHITAAKTRWGSCSSKGNINLSYRLMMLPPGTIDYVIIHELCHLHHFNHSKAFWKLVQQRCKDYKQHENELKKFAKFL